MKGFYFLMAVILALCMALSPLQAVKKPIGQQADQNLILIKDIESAEIIEVDPKEYVIGILAGNMSHTDPPEALKAVAVAALSYALHNQSIRISKGLEYDVISSKDDKYYLSTAKQVALWQDNYAEYRQVFEQAADSVSKMILTFENQPILAEFHSVSGGKTESAENVLGRAYPYLISVESACDLLSPYYLTTVTYSLEDFANRALNIDITLVGDSSLWLSEPKRSQSGTVLEYTLAGHAFSGEQMKNTFSIPSANFDLEYKNDQFTFTVRGKGHGMGLSLFGAVYMAKQGAKYSEILMLYYPNTKLSAT